MRCCILPAQAAGAPSIKYIIYRVALVMYYITQAFLHTTSRVCDFRKESLDCKCLQRLAQREGPQEGPITQSSVVL